MKKRMNQPLGVRLFIIEHSSNKSYGNRLGGENFMTPALSLDVNVDPTISPTFTFTITAPPPTLPPFGIEIGPGPSITGTGSITF